MKKTRQHLIAEVLRRQAKRNAVPFREHGGVPDTPYPKYHLALNP